MHAVLKAWGIFAVVVMLSGCATLPIAGPTGTKVLESGKNGAFLLVEVDSAAALPELVSGNSFDLLPPAAAKPEEISPGDVLSVTIYEVGVRLFSGAASNPGGQQFDPSAHSERISGLTLDAEGYIRLPYVGRVLAAGLTTSQLALSIENGLKGKSEFPQVAVTIEQPNGNSVIVGGEVNRPGRVSLTGMHEKLLDVISLAGGYRGKESDLIVQVERGGKTTESRLAAVKYENIGGMAMAPGDRIELVFQPQTYSVLGSSTKVDQFSFSLDKVSLVEAIAKAGGMDDDLANPAAVFVFRFQDAGTAIEKPTVFHLNMMKPASYLLAQKFQIHDQDVIYVAGAEANRPSKLLRIIGEIFTPILLARQLSK
jgi:polysaccharide biosynthesis/export protein